jgi:hypothetical protein
MPIPLPPVPTVLPPVLPVVVRIPVPIPVPPAPVGSPRSFGASEAHAWNRTGTKNGKIREDHFRYTPNRMDSST